MTWLRYAVGWPGIIASVGAFVIAFLRGQTWIAGVGLILATPFLWYTSKAPYGEWFSPMLFLGLAASVYLLRKGRVGLAFACFVPFLAVIGVLAIAVLSQRH